MSSLLLNLSSGQSRRIRKIVFCRTRDSPTCLWLRCQRRLLHKERFSYASEIVTFEVSTASASAPSQQKGRVPRVSISCKWTNSPSSFSFSGSDALAPFFNSSICFSYLNLFHRLLAAMSKLVSRLMMPPGVSARSTSIFSCSAAAMHMASLNPKA